MALIFSDGFDSYSATADLLRNWTSGASWPWNATSGINGGGCLKSVTSVVGISVPIGLTSIPATSNAGYCFWIKITATPSATLLCVNEFTSAGSYAGGLSITTGGLFRLTDNTGVTNRVTGVTNICDGNWHWVEWFRTSNTGSNALWIDGIVQWNGSFLIANAILAYFGINTAAQGNYFLDDFFFFDSTAGGPVTSAMPFGPRQIITNRYGSDSSIQFSPDSGGVNYSRVNEVASDDDVSYVQANTGNADEYGLAALPYTPVGILGVKHTLRVRNPGAGLINYKSRCHSGSTTSDSTAVVAQPNYFNNHFMYGTDPNTSAAWTPTNLANAKFGIVSA